MAKSPKKKTSKRSSKAAKSKVSGSKASGPAGLLTVLKPDGGVIAGRDPNLPEETLLYLYEQMVQVREFDRRMLMLQRQGRIGFYGPILGQEASTIGSIAATEDRDWIIPALREGAAAMMRGLPLDVAVAQLIGNEMDRCKGRQMPCHFTYREGNYMAMSSVIGTQISHAAGVAIAAKIKGDDVVVLGYMGDGATSANDFHAGMNFAAVYKAPCVMICQNNHWAISVPVKNQMVSETIAIKGEAYGMPSMRVDGNDVLAVYVATREAVERARRGEGPTFLELVTYRRLGHSSSDDPSRYRDEDEVEAWEKRDPVDRFRRYMENKGIWDADKEDAFKQDIADRVNAAITTAESANHPPAESLITDVFADVPDNLQRHYDDSIANSGIIDSDGHFPL
ncbi:MAG: thiamine pyrophosphate-dependent enzyme [Planctomycetota bacterium]|nr:thiamine pyrophosphate-dependent enzyme [Planctomycetota bacterium]